MNEWRRMSERWRVIESAKDLRIKIRSHNFVGSELVQHNGKFFDGTREHMLRITSILLFLPRTQGRLTGGKGHEVPFKGSVGIRSMT